MSLRPLTAARKPLPLLPPKPRWLLVAISVGAFGLLNAFAFIAQTAPAGSIQLSGIGTVLASAGAKAVVPQAPTAALARAMKSQPVPAVARPDVAIPSVDTNAVESEPRSEPAIAVPEKPAAKPPVVRPTRQVNKGRYQEARGHNARYSGGHYSSNPNGGGWSM